MKKTIGAIFIATILAVSGCSTLDPKAVQSQTAGKSIAVASTAGEKLNMMWIGTTTFNNESTQIAVPDWKVDEAIAKQAVANLQNTKRYGEVFYIEGTIRGSDGVPTVATDKKADYIVFIEPATYEDGAFMTNQPMRGIGIMQRTLFNSMKRTVGHASMKAEVYDTRSGKSVATYGTQNFWPTPVSLEAGPKITDSDMSRFKEGALGRIHGTVAEILEKLGLQ